MEYPLSLHQQLTHLNKMLLTMSAMIEERIGKATQLIKEKDKEAIELLIRSDYEIDDLEIQIEEFCLKILALHQPVAKDLRFIITVIKVNGELSKIGDIAVNIAKRVQTLSKLKHAGAIAYDFTEMAEKARQMLKKSIDALIGADTTLARSLFVDDDTVDALKDQCYEAIKQRIRKDPEHPGYHMNTFLLGRQLERIADRAVNIAAEVIYLAEGTIVRIN